jgi:hypothetical protein
MLAERSPSPWPLQCPVAYLRRPSAKIRAMTTSTMIQCQSVNFVMEPRKSKSLGRPAGSAASWRSWLVLAAVVFVAMVFGLG